MNGSPSKIPIRISVAGLGVAEGELVRFYAPLTVERLMSRLPLEGRAHPIRGGYSFIVDIKRGEEKSVREVEAGTIAYWPMGNSICIFHSWSIFSMFFPIFIPCLIPIFTFYSWTIFSM